MAENGPPVAFVTMVRDERIFLPLWVRYYARFVPRENLFVIMDGLDQSPPPECEGCQVLRLPQRPAVAGWDIARWQMLSDFAAALLGRFETVVLNDVDELVVLDPQFGTDLVSELRATREAGVISPFALEIVHRADLEPEPFDSSRPVLDQRRFVRLNASYCKPCIASERVRWSIGGHRSDFPRLSLSRRLFLFHLKYVDRDLLLARQAQRRAHVTESGVPASEVAGSGWRKSSSRAEAFLDSFVANGPPEVHDFSFDWQRRRIEESWKLDEASGFWTHCRLHNRRTYVLPDRFRGLM